MGILPLKLRPKCHENRDAGIYDALTEVLHQPIFKMYLSQRNAVRVIGDLKKKKKHNTNKTIKK